MLSVRCSLIVIDHLDAVSGLGKRAFDFQNMERKVTVELTLNGAKRLSRPAMNLCTKGSFISYSAYSPCVAPCDLMRINLCAVRTHKNS